MTDWTQKILNQYADKQAAGSKRLSLESFGSAPEPTEYDLKGGNFISGFNNGMNNLIKFAQTGDRRRAEARDQAIAAEAVNYQRGQDAESMALRVREDERADQRFKLDQTIQNRALQKELEAEQHVKNGIIFQRGFQDDVGNYDQQKALVDNTVKMGIESAYLQGDSKGNLRLVEPQNMTPEDKEKYEAYKGKFNNLPNMSEGRKNLEKKWQKEAEDTLLDDDKTNDVNNFNAAGFFDKRYNQSNEESTASLNSQVEAQEKRYNNYVLEQTGTLSGKDKEFLNDYDAVGGNLEISPDNFDNWIDNAGLNDTQRSEVLRLKDTVFNDKNLEGYTDAQKNWIIGSALKGSKGLGDKESPVGGFIDYKLFTRGSWNNGRVNSAIEKQRNKLDNVTSTSEKLRIAKLESNQLVNNIKAKQAYTTGRGNLVR